MTIVIFLQVSLLVLRLEWGEVKKGVPTIGNDVWIGPNAVVVGGITIGDNVLIAANSFVNFDVPPIVSLLVIRERLFHLRGRQKVIYVRNG